MITRIARRLLSAVLVLLVASLVAFAALDVTPGDAAQLMVGDSASEEQLQDLRAQLGLDRPMLVRYLDYLAGAVQGDLGKSLISGRPVAALIGERFASTLLLALIAVTAATLLGMALGLCSAARKGGWADLGIMAMLALLMAVPGYGLAMLFTLAFSIKLRLLPVAGGSTPLHIVLPALTLALPLVAAVARLSRSSLLDAASSDFVLAVHARGVPRKIVWHKHILRNALVPVITLVGLNFGHLLGGAFVVETIFGWPGLGRLIVQAVYDKDYPLILGAVLLLAVIFQLFNLIVDLAQGLLDPRTGSEAV
jgi:ABC-type dipeptide/oligopeptide/nickel transport system permease component